MNPLDIQPIILAAGCSSRLGQNKQFLKIANETLIRRAVQLVENMTTRRTWVMTGFAHEKIVNELKDTDCMIIHHAEWGAGLGSTIAKAVTNLVTQKSPANAALFVLPDQILITRAYLSQLILFATKANKSMIATNYAATYGPPILFKAKYFTELSQLSGKDGAKTLINRHRDDLATLNFEAAAIDIDRPEDLAQVGMKSL